MSNLTVLNVDDFIKRIEAKEVTNDAIINSKGKYSPDGLFSETIFGMDRSTDRSKKYGFIKLNTTIVHPFIYDVFKKLEVRLTELMDGAKYYYDEKAKCIYKDLLKEYRGDESDDNIKEVSGYDGAMYCILKGIEYRGESELRDKLIVKLKELIDNKQAFIDKILALVNFIFIFLSFYKKLINSII